MKEPNYDGWKKMVDTLLQSKIGLTSDDLPDTDTYGMWKNGTLPMEAAKEIIESAADQMGWGEDEIDELTQCFVDDDE